MLRNLVKLFSGKAVAGAAAPAAASAGAPAAGAAPSLVDMAREKMEQFKQPIHGRGKALGDRMRETFKKLEGEPAAGAETAPGAPAAQPPQRAPMSNRFVAEDIPSQLTYIAHISTTPNNTVVIPIPMELLKFSFS